VVVTGEKNSVASIEEVLAVCDDRVWIWGTTGTAGVLNRVEIFYSAQG